MHAERRREVPGVSGDGGVPCPATPWDRSGERPDAKAADSFEMLLVPSGETEMALERRCRYQCVRHPKPGLPAYSSGPFGNRAIDRNLTKGGKDARGEVGSCRTCEELGPRNHGIVEPVSCRFEFGHPS